MLLDQKCPAVGMRDILEIALALRSAPMFTALPADSLMPVANLCSEVDLAAGDTLYEVGELGDALYVVVRGLVDVRHHGKTIATLGPGQSVGEMAALDWEPRNTTCVAVEETRLVRLDRNDLLDLLADHPALVVGLASVLVDRLRRMNP